MTFDAIEQWLSQINLCTSSNPHLLSETRRGAIAWMENLFSKLNKQKRYWRALFFLLLQVHISLLDASEY